MDVWRRRKITSISSKPHGCLASKKNHIEQYSFITSRCEKGRSSVCNTTCAFCLHSFSSFNTTRLRVHLTGEEEGQTRVMACKRAPKAYRDFYRAERDSAATAAKAKQSEQISLIKDAMHTASEASDSRRFKKKKSSLRFKKKKNYGDAELDDDEPA